MSNKTPLIQNQERIDAYSPLYKYIGNHFPSGRLSNWLEIHGKET